MATPQFNPNKPSGFGADDSTGERWINQGPWKFDPITKALLPGQIPEQSLGPAPEAPAKTGGVEIPEVTGSSSVPAPEVTPPTGEVTVPEQLQEGPGTPPEKEVTGTPGQVGPSVTQDEAGPILPSPFPGMHDKKHKAKK